MTTTKQSALLLLAALFIVPPLSAQVVEATVKINGMI